MYCRQAYVGSSLGLEKGQSDNDWEAMMRRWGVMSVCRSAFLHYPPDGPGDDVIYVCVCLKRERTEDTHSDQTCAPQTSPCKHLWRLTASD